MNEQRMNLQQMKSEYGAAGVIEMSFILPFTMFVVLSLIYITFSMFLYVHLQSVAENAASAIENALYDEWNGEDQGLGFNGFALSDEAEKRILAEYGDKLRNLCVLPGMNVDFSFDISTDVFVPVILVKMECRCLKGELFAAMVEQKVYFPEDFANNFDLILDVSEDSGALVYAKERVEEVKKAYDEIF